MPVRVMWCQGSLWGHRCRWGFENSTDVHGGCCQAGSHAWRTVVCRGWAQCCLLQTWFPGVLETISVWVTGSVVPQSLPQGQLLYTCLVDMMPPSLTQAREHLILCEHLVLCMLPAVLPQVHREAWPTQRSTFRTYTLTLAVS